MSVNPRLKPRSVAQRRAAPTLSTPGTITAVTPSFDVLLDDLNATELREDRRHHDLQRARLIAMLREAKRSETSGA